jgi:hypothetical protein
MWSLLFPTKPWQRDKVPRAITDTLRSDAGERERDRAVPAAQRFENGPETITAIAAASARDPDGKIRRSQRSRRRPPARVQRLEHGPEAVHRHQLHRIQHPLEQPLFTAVQAKRLVRVGADAAAAGRDFKRVDKRQAVKNGRVGVCSHTTRWRTGSSWGLPRPLGSTVDCGQCSGPRSTKANAALNCQA